MHKRSVWMGVWLLGTSAACVAGNASIVPQAQRLTVMEQVAVLHNRLQPQCTVTAPGQIALPSSSSAARTAEQGAEVWTVSVPGCAGQAFRYGISRRAAAAGTAPRFEVTARGVGTAEPAGRQGGFRHVVTMTGSPSTDATTPASQAAVSGKDASNGAGNTQTARRRGVTHWAAGRRDGGNANDQNRAPYPAAASDPHRASPQTPPAPANAQGSTAAALDRMTVTPARRVHVVVQGSATAAPPPASSGCARLEANVNRLLEDMAQQARGGSPIPPASTKTAGVSTCREWTTSL